MPLRVQGLLKVSPCPLSCLRGSWTRGGHHKEDWAWKNPEWWRKASSPRTTQQECWWPGEDFECPLAEQKPIQVWNQDGQTQKLKGEVTFRNTRGPGSVVRLWGKPSPQHRQPAGSGWDALGWGWVVGRGWLASSRLILARNSFCGEWIPEAQKVAARPARSWQGQPGQIEAADPSWVPVQTGGDFC